LAPAGHLGDNQSSELREALAGLDLDAIREVILDLRAVADISSRTIGILLAFSKAAAEKNTALRLENASPDIHAMMTHLKLDRIIELGPENDAPAESPAPAAPRADGGQNAVLEIIGPLDDQATDRLAGELAQIDLDAVDEMVLDFSRAVNINSRTIGLIVAFSKRAAPAGARVRLSSLPESIFTVLKYLKLEKIMDISR
jgi:anti-anti-sigma factor